MMRRATTFFLLLACACESTPPARPKTEYVPVSTEPSKPPSSSPSTPPEPTAEVTPVSPPPSTGSKSHGGSHGLPRNITAGGPNEPTQSQKDAPPGEAEADAGPKKKPPTIRGSSR